MKKSNYKIIKFYLFLSLLLLFIFSNFFFSQNSFSQDSTPYELIGSIAIYLFDPYNSVPLTAERYAIGNLQDYLYLNKIKTYYLGKITLDAAIILAKDKGVNYLIQIKANLSEIINSVEGYGATYFVEVEVINISDRKTIFSSTNKASVERTLSESIAQAYSLSNAIKGAAEKIINDIVNLFKK